MDLQQIFPVSRSLVTETTWDRAERFWDRDADPALFFLNLSAEKASLKFPEHLPDLMRLEWAIYQVQGQPSEFSSVPEKLSLNPFLQVLSLSWKNLPLVLKAEAPATAPSIEPGPEWILVWPEPQSDQVRFEAGSKEDLLVLKMLAEEMEVEEVARMGNIPLVLIEEAIDRAVTKGILIPPSPKIQRDPLIFHRGEVTDKQFFSSPVFTLQWHITQACDLHCRHCYDRSSRASLPLAQSFEVLEDLKNFCRTMNVKGHISFTGGNPFLHPNFFEVYRAAVGKGFHTAILGNPVPRKDLEKLAAIENPGFFQVSLEGLPEHNDYIRGPGHFNQVLDFLSLLKEVGIYSIVMLTLTRENLSQVLPLAEMLRDKTEAFFFNRLSAVGEGARLIMPTREDFQEFLQSYLLASEENPLLGLKDNLFNILFYQKAKELFGGCAGHGCGAAFNFLTLLPDGEVHACRKFPSPIGNILDQSLEEIYKSVEAQKYRAGSQACAPCPIRPVCGGCLAVSSSLGLDCFQERDPFCFIS